MSSSRRSGEADEAQELLLQERLQILVERLRWSYAAIWTFNPQKRVLQWKRGYYFPQLETSKAAEIKPKLGWYAQQFYTTYRSCSFSAGTGFVGKANLERRNTWLSGDAVCPNAGSLEQSQFLSYAKIKTVMCIPWLDAVLELGTTNFVGENFQLMDQIQEVLSHDLLSLPSLHEEDVSASLQQHQQQQAQSTVESVLPLIPNPALNPSSSTFQSPFDINMSDQVWRSNMVDFTQSELDSSSALAAATWRVMGMGEKSQTGRHKIDIVMKASMTSHGLMNLSQTGADQFVRSRSTSSHAAAAATASSSTSVSSQGDQYSNLSSATNSVSPELLHHHIMQTLSPDPISVSISARCNPPDRASSTAVVPDKVHHQLESNTTIKHEHDAGARLNQSSTSFNFRRPDQYGIQQADLSLLEAHDHPGLNLSDVDMDTVTTHDLWKQYDGTTSLTKQHPIEFSTVFRKVQQYSSDGRGKSELLTRTGSLQRRHTSVATDVLRELDAYQQEEAAKSDMIHSSDHDFFPDLHESAAVNSAQPEMNDSSGATLRRPRSRATTSSKVSGAAATKHDEATLNHMMAERRRRVKQKENFATLRRLVPIISKADKASTLVDAIVYLKDLQNIITDMKAHEDNMIQRCKDLASKCSRLEDENKDLVAMLTKDKPAGEVVHLNRLHSMKSI